MATTFEKQGGLLYIKKDGVVNEPINLAQMEIKVNVNSETLTFQNGDVVQYDDVTSPSSTDFEDLIDQLGNLM